MIKTILNTIDENLIELNDLIYSINVDELNEIDTFNLIKIKMFLQKLNENINIDII